ncbi:MAG: BolA family protein [Burkholderiales bacterium]
MRPTPEELQACLQAAFPDAQISIQDDSHLHAGHAGSQGGAGHFTVRLVSPIFAGLTRIARHRLVYDPVRPWMPHRVHALVIHALAPEEAEAPTRNRS